MKKVKITALILAMACMVCAFAGCANVKWDDIKNKDVVATVNGTEITKQHILYYNAENYVSAQVSANLFSQMGMDEVAAEEDEIDTAFYDALSYYIVGELARANNYGITEEDAYEKAYQEYVLMEKKPGYEYIKEYNDNLKEMLYFDDDLLVEFATDKLYNSVPAMDYIEALLDEMQYDYPEDAETKNEPLKTAVAERLKEEAKTIAVTFNYHSDSALKNVDYTDIVSRASTTFTRTTTEDTETAE